MARHIMREYPFESRAGSAIVRREPIGVCALISPWNWPVQTGVIKMIYALAAGCTVVAKPGVDSAASGALMAQVLHEADVPPGVFNLVNGTGRQVGDTLSRHPGVDMISFTGSTIAGEAVRAAAAGTVKRVCLELGGKSANIVLLDANLEKAARWNIQRAFFNAGQSCHAPTRMLVHESQLHRWCPSSSTRHTASDWVTRWTARRPWASSAQPVQVGPRVHPGCAQRGAPRAVASSAPTASTAATSCDPPCSPR